MTRPSVQSSASAFDGWWAAAQTVTAQMNKTWQHLWGRAAEDQLEWIKLSLDYSGQQLDTCLTCSNPMALFEAESKMVTEFSGKFIEQWRKDFTLMQEAANEIMTCCQELSILPTQVLQPEEKSAPAKLAVKSPATPRGGDAEAKSQVA